MADITITHTRAEGTVLDGSSKGDGVYEIVSKHGFWWSRSVGIYIRNSRDREAQNWKINSAKTALEAAGHSVTVEINEGKRRSFAEAEVDRAERAEDRAERFENRADRAAASSDARHQAARDIMRHIPFGQPILVGHHSQRRAERDAERIDGHMRASIDEGKRAEYWASRSRSAEQYAEHRNNPQVTLRRLERLRADLRQQERYRDQAVEGGYDPGRHVRNIEDLVEEIAYWEKLIKEAEENGVKIWGPDDFAPRDYVLSRGTWYQVARVNPKTLSIAWNLRLAPKKVMSLEDATEPGYRTGTFTTDYSNVRARCPEAAMLAFLADGKIPGTTSAAAASAAEPASAIREALAAKPKPKKKANDPKVPKRVKVECGWNANEAKLTWLDGRSKPHKNYEPETITAPEGTKFTGSVWSPSLLAQVAALLTGRGYSFRGSGWSGGPGAGIVRAIEETPAPEPEVTETPEATAQPAPAPEEAPEPAEDEGRAPVAEPDPEPEPAPEETPQESEKTSLTCDFPESTRNHTGRSCVGISVYPLITTTPQELAMAGKYEMSPARKARREAFFAEMAKRNPSPPDVERTPALDAAYSQYISDGLADTDGYYAPIDFQAWAHTLGKPEVEAEAAAAVAEPPVEEAKPAPGPAEGIEEAMAEIEGALAEAKEHFDKVEEVLAGTETAEVEAAPAETEKRALTCENSGNTRNHSDRSRVDISVHPLNSNPQEPAMTATTTITEVIEAATPAPATEKKAAPKRAPRPKKAAPPAPAETETPEVAAKAPERKIVQKTIPTDRIDRDPTQPREIFDQVKLDELTRSMQRLGQLQPITVRYMPGTRRYTLVMGERRWRAAQAAGITEMTALVQHGIADGERETLAKSTAENVGRADMTPIEEAKAFDRLVKAEYTIDEVAEMCGKSAAYVGWRIDLLRLCEPARDALAKGLLTVGLAWYVSLLNANNQMRFLTRHARGEFKSTRDAEAFAQAARNEEKRQEEQGSFFVLAEETPDAAKAGGQESLPGSIEVPEEERERIHTERAKVTKKIDKLADAGAILSELATMDPEELALLLAGTPGGIPGHALRIEHLRDVALRATKTLRQAQAIAAVRANSIQINPDAEASTETDAA
ncbi:ParB/RepB/Spo0J family partition protein [Streptomyces goshikiensis]|uniref:ParB/RepB/Spo0J family partition protein n=1 Tax=Streptomyces goshikiensis TaxID=1942 RepID=UPI00364CC1A5